MEASKCRLASGIAQTGKFYIFRISIPNKDIWPTVYISGDKLRFIRSKCHEASIIADRWLDARSRSRV